MAKKKSTTAKSGVASETAADVSSVSSNNPPVVSPATDRSDTTMADKISLNLTRSDKKRRNIMVVYTVDGYKGSIRFSKTLFADKAGPATLTVDSEAFAAPPVVKAALTAEERKAARAARPKLTKAQKVAKLQERLDKLKADAAKDAEDNAAEANTETAAAAM